MSNILNYIKTRGVGWWASTVLLIFIIVLLIFPNIRQNMIVWFVRQGLKEPEIAENTVLLSDEDFKFSYQDLEDNPHFLIHQKGKVIFLNFWATWCAPCLSEMHGIEKLYEEFGKEVEFIIFSFEEKNDIQNLQDRKKYNLPIYRTLLRPTPFFLVKTYPTTFIISKKGEVIVNQTGAVDWSSDKIRNLLRQLIEE